MNNTIKMNIIKKTQGGSIPFPMGVIMPGGGGSDGGNGGNDGPPILPETADVRKTSYADAPSPMKVILTSPTYIVEGVIVYVTME